MIKFIAALAIMLSFITFAPDAKALSPAVGNGLTFSFGSDSANFTGLTFSFGSDSGPSTNFTGFTFSFGSDSPLPPSKPVKEKLASRAQFVKDYAGDRKKGLAAYYAVKKLINIKFAKEKAQYKLDLAEYKKSLKDAMDDDCNPYELTPKCD